MRRARGGKGGGGGGGEWGGPPPPPPPPPHDECSERTCCLPPPTTTTTHSPDPRHSQVPSLVGERVEIRLEGLRLRLRLRRLVRGSGAAAEGWGAVARQVKCHDGEARALEAGRGVPVDKLCMLGRACDAFRGGEGVGGGAALRAARVGSSGSSRTLSGATDASVRADLGSERGSADGSDGESEGEAEGEDGGVGEGEGVGPDAAGAGAGLPATRSEGGGGGGAVGVGDGDGGGGGESVWRRSMDTSFVSELTSEGGASRDSLVVTGG